MEEGASEELCSINETNADNLDETTPIPTQKEQRDRKQLKFFSSSPQIVYFMHHWRQNTVARVYGLATERDKASKGHETERKSTVPSGLFFFRRQLIFVSSITFMILAFGYCILLTQGHKVPSFILAMLVLYPGPLLPSARQRIQENDVYMCLWKGEHG